MKKYKEWLTNEIEIMESETSENYPHEQMVEREVVLNLINQLDEPEALSQKWIDKNKVARINNLRKMTMSDVLPVDKLQDLLVPKQEEITELDALNRLAQNVQFSADEIANHLERLSAYNGQVTYGNQEILSQDWIDEHKKSYTMEDSVEISELQNLLVPKQELPVIPKYVADFLKKFNVIYDSCVRYLVEAHNGDLYYLNDMMVEDGDLTLDEATELCEWAEKQKQSDLLKLINGYTVEKEPKYYVIFPSVDENGKGFNYLAKDTYHNELWIEDSRTDGLDWEERSSFTEDEIRDLDKGDILFEQFAVKVEEKIKNGN